MRCGICGKESRRPRDIWTVRKAWVQAGGWGTILESAIVHLDCDAQEQRKLTYHQIELSDLYVKCTEAG